MKILVTGGAGFIGSHLTDLLIENNHKVIIIDNLSTGKKENINPLAIFYQEDLKNENSIEEIFQKEKPEIVYHLAAQINLRKSLENPTHDAEINIINTQKLLEICKKNKIKHFIFSSTGGAIYGEVSDKLIPTKESTHEQPLSPYGCAKLAIEKYLIFYNKVNGLKFTSLRYSNVYGPRQNPEGEAGVISIFFKSLLENKAPTIFGGIQTRDFIYVGDVVRANLLALNDTKSNIYNIGTGKEIDIIEIINKIKKYFKKDITPIFEPMKKGEQKRSCLNYDKIKENLNWQPLIKLEEGLDRVYCWFLKTQKLNKQDL
jgi:UDP-glucose 4-epimerase